MDLRDALAAAALRALIPPFDQRPRVPVGRVAAAAYLVADAMLAARALDRDQLLSTAEGG